jgi:hypothetical protein
MDIIIILGSALVFFAIFKYLLSKNIDFIRNIEDKYDVIEETIIIRFDEENNILISNNANLIKDDIIRIIKEVAKLKTID